MYVPASDTGCNTLNGNIGSASTATTSAFTIKVTDICLKYEGFSYVLKTIEVNMSYEIFTIKVIAICYKIFTIKVTYMCYKINPHISSSICDECYLLSVICYILSVIFYLLSVFR